MRGEAPLLPRPQVKLTSSSYHRKPRAAPGSAGPTASRRAESSVYAGVQLVLPHEETRSSVLLAWAGILSSPMGVFSVSHPAASPRRECPRSCVGEGQESFRSSLFLSCTLFCSVSLVSQSLRKSFYRLKPENDKWAGFIPR